MLPAMRNNDSLLSFSRHLSVFDTINNVALFDRLQAVCNDHHGLPSMQAVNGIHNGIVYRVEDGKVTRER